MLVKNVSELIGHTPILEIDPEVHGLKNIRLYAKLEHLNPFGSLKDRPALNILRDSLAEIKSKGQTVIESSSGNMAKAMTVLCSMNGVSFRVVTNRIQVREVKQMLQYLGAEVNEFPGMSSCPDPTDPNNPVAFIEREVNAHPGKYFHTSQYTNEKNSRAHKNGTGPEILADVPNVHYFVAGMGTTGSSRGAGEFLKDNNPALIVVGVVAKKGHVVPGIRNSDEMHEVGLFKKDFYSQIVEIETSEAIDGMVSLARKLGVLAGATSGGAYTAALKYLQQIDATLTEKRNAVFIVNDRVEWYLSYLQKYRPELFGLTVKKDSLRAVTDEQAVAASQLSVDEAQRWLGDATQKTLVVDLRGNLAYKAGHVASSINLPADHLEDITEFGVPFSSSQRVLFICPVGEQSRKFAVFFSARGITSASLCGGFIAWRDAGKPIEKLSPASVKTQ